MEPRENGEDPAQQPRTAKQILLSYFYWTYQRGSFHYDVMVTLILVFIFVTPQVWHYGDRPVSLNATMHPIVVTDNSAGRGFIVTVEAADVHVPDGASVHEVRKILRDAIEPVTGDAVFVEHWETVTDQQGNLVWRVWAHR